MIWCSQKYDRAHLFSLDSEYRYWDDIKNIEPGFLSEYLNEQIGKAELHRESANGTKEYWGVPSTENIQYTLETGRIKSDLLRDDPAKKYLFYYGIKDGIDNKSSNFNLFSIYRSIITCPLATYGAIFQAYHDGFHTAKRIAFLRKQKARLDRSGDEEILRYPESKKAEQPAP